MPLRHSPALVIAIGLTFLGHVCGSASTQPAPANTSAAPSSAAGVKLPAFRPGMWEYTRTTQVAGARGKPATTSVRKCTDPTREIEGKLAQMKQKGCQFAPMSREGNHYRSTLMCPVQGGSLNMSEVITVKSDSSYEDANESRFGNQVTRTSIVATRVGECEPQAAAAPPPKP